jgi:hypothetical protein
LHCNAQTTANDVVNKIAFGLVIWAAATRQTDEKSGLEK